MNREIKFRVWDGDTMRYSFDGFHDEVDVLSEVWVYFKDSKYHAMQYTGLKDKNGKEIYEGDIIKKSYGQAFVKKRLNEIIGIVEFCEYEVLTDDWGVTHKSLGWNIEFSDKSGRISFDSKYEVTGNIHENPNLLK